jgi:hypothetical protein
MVLSTGRINLNSKERLARLLALAALYKALDRHILGFYNRYVTQDAPGGEPDLCMNEDEFQWFMHTYGQQIQEGGPKLLEHLVETILDATDLLTYGDYKEITNG